MSTGVGFSWELQELSEHLGRRRSRWYFDVRELADGSSGRKTPTGLEIGTHAQGARNQTPRRGSWGRQVPVAAVGRMTNRKALAIDLVRIITCDGAPIVLCVWCLADESRMSLRNALVRGAALLEVRCLIVPENSGSDQRRDGFATRADVGSRRCGQMRV